MNRLFVIMIFVLATFLSMFSSDIDKDIQGKWEIDEMIGAGEKAPKLDDFFYVFDENEVVILFKGEEKMRGRYVIDKSIDHNRIILPDAKDGHTSIIKMENNKIIICSNSIDPKVKAPTEFISNKSNKYLLMVLKKVQ